MLLTNRFSINASNKALKRVKVGSYFFMRETQDMFCYCCCTLLSGVLFFVFFSSMALPRVFDLLDHGRSIAPPPTPKQAAQAAADAAAAKASAEDSSVHNNYFLLEKFYTMVRFGRKKIIITIIITPEIQQIQNSICIFFSQTKCSYDSYPHMHRTYTWMHALH